MGIFLFPQIIVETSAASTSFTRLNISLGVYKQELQSPLFYESFIPIIYEYNVPKYSTLDITLRDWREKCKTENFAPSYTCPVFYHYEKYLERFEAEAVPRAWAKDAKDTTSQNLPSVPISTYDFCNNIQKHFPGSITQQFGFEEYVEKLQKCPLGDIVISRGVNDYVYGIKQLFKSMNKNYESEFSNAFIGAGNSKLTPAFYVNAVTTHQNGMLIAYILEMKRWSEAELSCNSQHTPSSLVKVNNLTTSLNQVDQLLKAHNLVSSMNLAETSAFYKLPITDCSYIETNGNFVVRIQIPILRKGLNPKLFRVDSLPFVFTDDSDTSGGSRQLCQIRSDPRTFIFDKPSGILQVSKCNPMSPICKLENFASSDVVSPCLSSIFSENMEGVKKYCEMDCVPWKENSDGLKILPAFHRVQPDTYLVTGQTLSGVTIKCQEKQDKALEHPEIGALEVKLPCDCYLAYQTDTYYPDSSCDDDFDPSIKHILPVHFIRDDKLGEIQKTISANYSENEIIFQERDLIISGDAAAKSFEGYMPQSSPHVFEASNNPHAEGGNFAFIWVVFVVQLICLMAIVAVPAYKYIDRKRKLNAFSKERLVYNAYPSTSNPNISVTSSSTDTYPYAPSQSQRSSVIENNLNA